MTFTSLILAFYWAPLLTLTIRFTFPILIIVQGFSGAIAGPRLAHFLRVQHFLSRAATNIGTLKASNAHSHEFSLLGRVPAALLALSVILSATARSILSSQCPGLLARRAPRTQRKIQPRGVMGIFWTCLIATSNLQMAVPLLIVLAKGKFAAAKLASLIAFSTPTDRIY